MSKRIGIIPPASGSLRAGRWLGQSTPSPGRRAHGDQERAFSACAARGRPTALGRSSFPFLAKIRKKGAAIRRGRDSRAFQKRRQNHNHKAARALWGRPAGLAEAALSRLANFAISALWRSFGRESERLGRFPFGFSIRPEDDFGSAPRAKTGSARAESLGANRAPSRPIQTIDNRIAAARRIPRRAARRVFVR